MARYDDYDDDSVFDENGLLKDGCRVRVGLMMRDGLSDVQRSVAAAARVGFDDTLARHQSGPVPLTDRAGLDAKARAYADSVKDLTEAWRNPPPSASDAWKTNNMSDREVARVRNTGDPVRDAYLDGVADLTTAWSRRR